MSGGKAYGEGFAIVPDSVLYAKISASAFVLWCVLQRHSDPEGRSYPGRKRMAQLMGCSEDTITRAKRELAEAGLLEVRERFDEHGRRTTDDLFLRHARRKFAATGRRTDAATNSKAVELEPDELEVAPAAAKPRPPTDTSQIPAGKPTPQQREAALRRLREIRQQYDPADCEEFGCHEEGAR